MKVGLRFHILSYRYTEINVCNFSKSLVILAIVSLISEKISILRSLCQSIFNNIGRSRYLPLKIALSGHFSAKYLRISVSPMIVVLSLVAMVIWFSEFGFLKLDCQIEKSHRKDKRYARFGDCIATPDRISHAMAWLEQRVYRYYDGSSMLSWSWSPATTRAGTIPPGLNLRYSGLNN